MSSTALPQTPMVPAPASFTVASFDGTVIHYDVYDQPSRGLVVVVPGFWRDRKHPAMARLAGLVHQAGFRVAVVDVRGHGQSEGIYGFNLHEHYDVAAVVTRLLATSAIESSPAARRP